MLYEPSQHLLITGDLLFIGKVGGTKTDEDARTECPECGGTLRKEYGSIGVTFNGSGFYRTDSRAGANTGSGSSGSGSSGSGASGGDTGGSSASSSSETKSSPAPAGS